MASLAFTVDWGDTNDKEEEVYIAEPRRAVSDGQASTAWEIDFSSFSSGNGQAKPPKQVIPKFLRDYKTNPVHSDVKGQPDSIAKTGNNRSAVTPLKARGVRLPMKSVSATSLSSFKSKGLSKANSCDKVMSPKKQLPAIRKPLLPVTSPVKKPIRSLDPKFQSECALSPRASNKALKGVVDHTLSKKKTRLQNSSSFLGAIEQQERVEKTEDKEKERTAKRDETTEVCPYVQHCTGWD